MDYQIVATNEELKEAVSRKIRKIIITDKELALRVKRIRGASRVAVTSAIAAVGAGGIAAFNFWNPAGWISGAVGAVAGTAAVVSGGSVIITIVAILGGVVILAIIKDYKVKVANTTTLPDGTEVKTELVLEK